MPSYRTGTVTALLSERQGLQRVEVDGEQAYVLTQLIGTVAVGDRVVMNTTAVELGLGTGGSHVVHWNLERDAWSEPGPGHEMKLRYTSLQVDTGVAAAPGPSASYRCVVACFLHSQVAAVAAGFKHVRPAGRVTYVMTEGGALPLAVSDLVANLRTRGLLDATVTTGQAFGGDREAVNLHQSFGLAEDGDVIIVAMGPGSLGSATPLGFSGMEVAQVIDAAEATSHRCVVALRYSDADPRERHQGISHHTVTALRLARSRATIAIPRGEPTPEVGDHDVVVVDVPDLSDLQVTSMGRTVAEDPKFFAYAAAAGVYAAQLLVGER